MFVACLAASVALLLIYLLKFCVCEQYNDSSDFEPLPEEDRLDDEYTDTGGSRSSSIHSRGSIADSNAAPLKSFYREKFQQWTGARRKREGGYELTQSRSSSRNSVGSSGSGSAAVTSALHGGNNNQ